MQHETKKDQKESQLRNWLWYINNKLDHKTVQKTKSVNRDMHIRKLNVKTEAVLKFVMEA